MKILTIYTIVISRKVVTCSQSDEFTQVAVAYKTASPCLAFMDIEHTYSQYTRERADVIEDKIVLKPNKEYRQIFLDVCSGTASADGLKFQGGQKYNTNYGVLFEIINDMVTYPLINNWEIMDLLMYDRDFLYCLSRGSTCAFILFCISLSAFHIEKPCPGRK